MSTETAMTSDPRTERDGSGVPDVLLHAGRVHTRREPPAAVHAESRRRLLESWSEPPRSKSWLSPAPIVAVALAVLFVAWGAHRVVNPVAIGKDVTPSTSQTAAAPAALSLVTIVVVPSSATLYWDDVAVTGSPAVRAFVRDGLPHRLRAEAAGYATKSEVIMLDTAEVSVQLELAPQGTPPTSP
jgi:hypothetical protein